MIHHVIQRLADSAAVASETAGRVFPLFRLQGSDIPAITVQLTGTEPVGTKDRLTDYEVHEVEITYFHDSPKAAWELSVTCRDLLDGWSNNAIKQSRFVNQATDIYQATEVFTITQRYEIHMDR